MHRDYCGQIITSREQLWGRNAMTLVIDAILDDYTTDISNACKLLQLQLVTHPVAPNFQCLVTFSILGRFFYIWHKDPFFYCTKRYSLTLLGRLRQSLSYFCLPTEKIWICDLSRNVVPSRTMLLLTLEEQGIFHLTISILHVNPYLSKSVPHLEKKIPSRELLSLKKETFPTKKTKEASLFWFIFPPIPPQSLT